MPTEPPPPDTALVLRIDAKVCHVELEGQRLLLPLAGKLFEERRHEKKPVAVGDHVVVRTTEQGQVIDAVQPRKTQLTRRAASEGDEQRSQVVAANISLVLVVTAAAEPPFQPDLVDGVLAGARRQDIPAALVVTKMDRDKKGRAQEWIDLYRRIGYRVLATSTAKGHETTAEFAALADLLRENRTVLCGLSGVGKSTLLNVVVPGLDLRIGSLSHIRQGKHTTSHTELIPLPGGGHVLDTPGVRSFHLFHAGSQEIQFLFPEFAALLPQCEYRNCLHLDEPGCAVSAARAAGEIAPSRFRSYRLAMVDALTNEHRPVPEFDDDEDDGFGARPQREPRQPRPRPKRR